MSGLPMYGHVMECGSESIRNRIRRLLTGLVRCSHDGLNLNKPPFRQAQRCERSHRNGRPPRRRPRLATERTSRCSGLSFPFCTALATTAALLSAPSLGVWPALALAADSATIKGSPDVPGHRRVRRLGNLW